DQGRGGREPHRPRQLVHRGRPRRSEVRLHARQPAVRRRVEDGQGLHRGGGETRSRRSVRRGPTAHQRRVLPLLQHMLSKMRPVEQGGTRLAIVFNGSPLFTGGAESGESEIRRWILENDWLEGIVALPDQLFYNTGISTYFWILSNRKPQELRRKVILLDARDQWVKMPKSLGDKRKMIADDQIADVTRLYAEALTAAADPSHPGHAKVKVFATTNFGYQRITVERPLKLRFEISDDTLAALTESKPLSRYDQ